MFAERKVIPLHTRPSTDIVAAAGFGANVPDMNLRVVWGLAQWVRDRRGLDVFNELCGSADILPERFDGKSHWVSHDRFEAFLLACRLLMSSDEAFEEACIHRLPEAYGPFRFALWAVSPRLMYVQAAKNMHMVSGISTVEVVEQHDNYLHARYDTKRNESALMSLSREAQTRAIPTLWGLPKAELRVLTREDGGRCEYEVRWPVKPGWLPTFFGASSGVALSILVYFGLVSSTPVALFLLPLLGAASGHIFDLHRANRLNRDYGSSQSDALQELANEAVEAAREVFELSQRQQAWTQLMEEQVADRTEALQGVVDRIGRQQVDQRHQMRGVSHDLRNPLQVITSTVELLRSSDSESSTHAIAMEALEASTANMQAYLEQLLNTATSGTRFVVGAPEEVEVAHLTDVLRRRLKAFVRDPAVRTSVFGTREAPETLLVNRVVLDRVLDNLLTNAAKYTLRGSIVVDVGGTPGFLTIKVSDTGRGIEEQKLKAIFSPEGSDEESRAPKSYGLGLSIVLRLMHEIGGHLEVMSRPGEGTTFWAHFPRTPPEMSEDADSSLVVSQSELMQRVVTIRQV